MSGTLYFVRTGKNIDEKLRGIYVSYWVETPYETAVRITKETIAEKESLVEQLNETIAKESEILVAFDTMLESGDYEGMTKQEVSEARREVLAGIKKQEMAKKFLMSSIDHLKTSYLILVSE